MEQLSFGYDEDTSGGQQAQANLEAIRGCSLLLSLSDAFSAAIDLEYETVDEIDSILEQLESLYSVMIDDSFMTPELIDDLTSARQLFQNVIEVERLNARKVVTDDVGQATPRTLAFTLYGDDALRNTLSSLNDVPSYGVLKNSTRILSQ